MQSSRRRGFTLVELLVVVAIIALLISILLPSLQQARAQARQLLGMTNLRTQGQAVYQYADQSRGFVTRGIAVYTGNAGDEYSSYARSLLPYLGYTGHIPLWNGGFNNEELRDVYESIPFYQCPDHPDPRSTLDYVSNGMAIPYTDASVTYDDGHEEYSEGDFGSAVPDDIDAVYPSITQLDEIGLVRSPADTILATEVHTKLSSGGVWKDVRYHHFFVITHLPFGGWQRIASDQRHPGGLNALFFDGHGETMALKKMDPAWPADLELRARWFTTFARGVEP